MDKKKSLQYSLLILLIFSSIIFYKKFFSENGKIAEKKIDEKKINNYNSDKKTKNSNVIETLKYISQDLVGNTYIINAESAKFVKDKTENVILFIVNAEIIRQDDDIIKINSDEAIYNKRNNDTIFKKAVSIEYGDQLIKSEVVKLNFSKNLIEIIENVHYMNRNTKIYADKVELDLLKKKMKISMVNQNDNIQITGKY
jgi:lipopolysaccharide assembly outer membrane protein LptD (OstA)